MHSQGMAAAHRRELADRLREKSAQIEGDIFNRISAREQDVSSDGFALYGAHEIIRPLLDHGIVTVELGERRAPALPPVVIAHARNAAWLSLSDGILRRRYLYAYSVFKQAVLREYGSLKGSPEDLLPQILASTDTVYAQLNEVLELEYREEVERKNRSPKTREFERVKGLLFGELIEAPELHYDLAATHIGLIGSGDQLASVLHGLAKALDGTLLRVDPSPSLAWAWIGYNNRNVTDADLKNCLDNNRHSSLRLAIGEPAAGLAGWRSTYRQAEAAFLVARHGSAPVVWYANVALLASVINNEILKTSLRKLISPLAEEPDGGKTLRETLRVYLSSERRISPAAALLGVKRHTVRSRLDAVEKRLGRTLASCAAELELALQAEELSQATGPSA